MGRDGSSKLKRIIENGTDESIHGEPPATLDSSSSENRDQNTEIVF